jgi:hypothetical protein
MEAATMRRDDRCGILRSIEQVDKGKFNDE